MGSSMRCAGRASRSEFRADTSGQALCILVQLGTRGIAIDVNRLLKACVRIYELKAPLCYMQNVSWYTTRSPPSALPISTCAAPSQRRRRCYRGKPRLWTAHGGCLHAGSRGLATGPTRTMDDALLLATAKEFGVNLFCVSGSYEFGVGLMAVGAAPGKKPPALNPSATAA